MGHIKSWSLISKVVGRTLKIVELINISFNHKKCIKNSILESVFIVLFVNKMAVRFFLFNMAVFFWGQQHNRIGRRRVVTDVLGLARFQVI